MINPSIARTLTSCPVRSRAINPPVKASGIEKPKEENKIKTKAKKKTYITGLHGSGAAKMKAEIRRKRANRHKGK